jgi:hypothetical protein
VVIAMNRSRWLAFVSAGLAVIAGAVIYAVAPSHADGKILSSYSDEQLVAAFDSAINEGVGSEEAMSLAAELMQRRATMDTEQLIAIIIDDQAQQMTRESLVDVLAGEPGSTRLPIGLRPLLLEGQPNPDLQARILSNFQFVDEDVAILRDIAANRDDVAGFHALKVLTSADVTGAKKIAQAIVNNSPRESELRLSAAYKVLIRTDYIKDSANRTKLIRHLSGIIDDPEKSEDLHDSALFALAEMQSFDSMRALLNSERADRGLVAGAVDENAAILLETLNATKDPATIKLIASAMRIHPICEFAEPLRDAVERVRDVTVNKKESELDVLISDDCVPLNNKWTEE